MKSTVRSDPKSVRQADQEITTSISLPGGAFDEEEACVRELPT